MSYVGNTPTQQAFTPAVDFFNGNGSTTAFTLSRPVASVAQVQAVISNVPQKPGDAFTVSGNTITFTSAPPSGTQNIYVYYTSPITQVIAPGQGTVGTTALVDGSVTPAKLSTGAPIWDSAGNVSFGGSALNSWTVYSNVLQTTGAALATNGTAAVLGANWYYDGQNRYKANGYASLYIQSDGAHSWYSAASGSVGNTLGSLTTIMSVDRGRSLALQGASTQAGTGITFPASQSASTDANTLDDYEEGSWTPTIGLGTFTYGSARYTKVGRIVTVSAYCQNFSDRSTASNLAIGGLPFASASSGSDAVGSLFMRYTNNPVTAVYISTNTSTILFYGSVSGNYANLLHSNLNNSLAEIYFTITYTTNT